MILSDNNVLTDTPLTISISNWIRYVLTQTNISSYQKSKSYIDYPTYEIDVIDTIDGIQCYKNINGVL